MAKIPLAHVGFVSKRQFTNYGYSKIVLFRFLAQIWEAVDPRQDGCVTRDGLYKALALTALAQQGKSISDKAVEQFFDSGKNWGVKNYWCACL